MSEKRKAVVVYSGGMDSFTVLHRAIESGAEVYAINFNYGQRHDVEISKAIEVCYDLGLPFKRVNIVALNSLINNSALTGDIEVPKGHYEDETMKQTVVPNRNMMLLSMAAAYAVNIGATELWYGAHSGDHAIYPDCRPEFVEAMEKVLAIANYEPIELVVPFIHGNKQTILEWGMQRELDYSKTWTCYDPQWDGLVKRLGEPKACGKCGSCQERLEAFELIGQTDPVEYV
tara:strand:- start:1746 stop:2438 length:693 start_codon:yes stop_codon:yes gene_type:complete